MCGGKNKASMVAESLGYQQAEEWVLKKTHQQAIAGKLKSNRVPYSIYISLFPIWYFLKVKLKEFITLP